MSEITITYRDIVITYDERGDKWTFELDGRERFAKSLTLAKEAIDKPPPKSKKPFVKVKALYREYYSNMDFEKVEITSLAETSRGAGAWYWISNDGKRNKVPHSSLYADTKANRDLVAKMIEKSEQIDQMEKEKKELASRMTNVVIPNVAEA